MGDSIKHSKGKWSGTTSSRLHCDFTIKCVENTKKLDEKGYAVWSCDSESAYCPLGCEGHYGISTDGLKSIGGNACTSSKPCAKCEGDCDEDSQCSGSMKCFQREDGRKDLPPGDAPIPGCHGVGKRNWDYCYYPMWVANRNSIVNKNNICDEEGCGQNVDGTITSLSSGKCLHISRHNVVHVGQCNEDIISQWTLSQETQEIVSGANGMCLDYAVKMNEIHTAHCNGYTDQQWQYDAVTHEITLIHNGQCMELGVGNEVGLAPCNGDRKQKWEIS